MSNWIIVVDDDAANLKMAGHILSKNGMRVTALKSGRLFLDYIAENGQPDLVLLDIRMPGMDGFETLDALRKYENSSDLPEVPVVFLTAHDASGVENRGFEMGVSDFIHKPFDPDVLVRRVENIIHTNEKMQHYEESATIDVMTGFLNKAAVNDKFPHMCLAENGCLCIIDLDSFKLVNDIYGHDMGDRILTSFATIVEKCMRYDATFGRIGGDEFIVFARGLDSEAEIGRFTDRLNEDFLREARKQMGEDMKIPLGASVGAVFVPQQGRDFSELFHLADQALYMVKHNGKHGYSLYRKSIDSDEDKVMDLETMTSILEERNISPYAMWMGKENFGSVYRYMIRYMERYHGSAYRALFTVDFIDPDVDDKTKRDTIESARECLQNSLRNSDVMMQMGEKQFFLLLPEIKEDNIDKVVSRMDVSWAKNPKSFHARLLHETGVVEINHSDRKEEK